MKKHWNELRAMSINTRKYIENYLVIQDKNAEIIPLKLNNPQLKLYNALMKQYKEGKPQRAIVLKARQMGFSTATEAIIFKKTATRHNIKSGIVTHEASATNNLFEMSKRFLDNLPDELKPKIKKSNAKELVFNNENGTGLNSMIKCMTAGNDNIGRSDTFQNLHISEYAFWEGDKIKTLIGLLQAVPSKLNTMVVIESTANGFDDFKDMWDDAVAGKSQFIPVFCAWHELDEYRREYDGFELTKEEIELKELYNLDNEQLSWRRWCIQNNCRGDINLFKQEYPSCPEEAFLSSGNCVFDKEKIINRIQQIRDKEPIKVGSFLYDYNGLEITNIRWQDDPNGIIKIYKDVEAKKPYVLSGDTAGDGSDNFVGEVLDNISGEQAAELSHKTDEDLYARQMYCLGMYYNQALIGIEVNFSTYPEKELERLHYPKLYQRQIEDSITHKRQLKYGFKTTSITRPIIIAGLVEVIRDDIDTINSVELLRECLSFVRNDKGRAEAEQGKHDDRVMASAIAYYIRPQQAMTIEIEKEKSEEEQREERNFDAYVNYGVGGYDD